MPVTTSGAIRPLRRHLVRRVPRRADLEARTPMVLTERDREILHAIHIHGFLTTDLIGLAFFPPAPGGRSTPSSRCYERVDQLFRWDFVERVELPVARTAGGRRPYLYALGQRGLPVVSPLLAPGEPPAQRRRLDRLVELFVDHELTVARLWANLAALLRSRGIRWSWESERQIRRHRMRVQDTASRWKLAVLPDGYFRVDYPDSDVQCGLVEVDMGTLTLARFRRKVRAIEIAREAGVFGWRWGHDDVDVAVVTHSAARLRNLQAAARAEVPEWRQRQYLFATLDALEPARFGGRHWLPLEEDAQPERLLYDAAYPDEGAT
jgi:hypothetical protein